ncbi:large ribosomal subunit protein bL17m [Parasteatoda tepidariorum]|uniref:large ribosomal subunit protein bL17m n=1 Tax=Parasteatoda tepidariorum TaxID=114398 RepID=UPI00077FB90F|nr:39S ribosomal protein L17, mitochondrial [Parasteatoda tepidariorum]
MAEIAKLLPRIKFSVKKRHVNLKNVQDEGPYGRVKKIRTVLSALFKYERIELFMPKCNEVRGYAERLITEAVRNGDKHGPTMEMANFWLEDKQMVHKLFKVLAPRYQNCQGPCTAKHLLPDKCHLAYEKKAARFLPLCILELKDNPYPPVPQKPKPTGASLTNILLKEASKEFRKMKLESGNKEKKQ